jgi:hypothetical protein
LRLIAIDDDFGASFDDWLGETDSIPFSQLIQSTAPWNRRFDMRDKRGRVVGFVNVQTDFESVIEQVVK